MNNYILEAVRKRKHRVIEKLKEAKIVDPSYSLDTDESSEYDDSDEETQAAVKVCETCFVFYLNALKCFEIDGHNNLAEKKFFRPKPVSEESERRKTAGGNEEV